MSRIENLVGCRNVLAGAFASAVMIAMSTSGAMAVVGCAGTAGTSGFTSTQAQFNLQCMQPIILPTTLQPLQSFGGSELVRTNSTTATYYLADRTNRGIIVVNAQSMAYKTIMKPMTTGTSTAILNSIGAITGYKGADPTGGFIGASIYAAGPSNQGYGQNQAPWKRSIPARIRWRSTKIPVTRMTTDGCLSPMAPA